MPEDPEFVGRALRPRSLKGIGWVQVWKLSRVGSEPGAEGRRNVRWERFREVVREIDELRNRGEKLGPPGMNVGDFRDPLLADARAGGRVRSARA